MVSELVARLTARRSEFERTVFARVCAVSDPVDVRDPSYAEGLRGAVSVAVAYALDCIEDGEPGRREVPVELLAQARHAARSGVELDTVVRRYVAGYSLLSELVMREAQRAGVGSEDQRWLTRSQAAVFDQVTEAAADAYRDELCARARSQRDRRIESVRRLLVGELFEVPDLNYDLDAWHIAAIATSPDADGPLRDLADALDCCLLLLPDVEGVTWAWLGARDERDPWGVIRNAEAAWSGEDAVALGESCHGLLGWRFTHRQAAAALPLARRSPGQIVRYGDVALLATALHDDLLRESLQHTFLAPLAEDGGCTMVLLDTLSAYFAADRHVSSTAAALGVTRQTVSNRLRAIEERLERPLGSCSAELEIALRLAEL